jgi:hypothetical protein
MVFESIYIDGFPRAPILELGALWPGADACRPLTLCLAVRDASTSMNIRLH